MAKLFQELQRHGKFPFELVFLVMDPGYSAENRSIIESNAQMLQIPITVLKQIFSTLYIGWRIIRAICVPGCAGGICIIRQNSWDATRLRWGITSMMLLKPF